MFGSIRSGLGLQNKTVGQTTACSLRMLLSPCTPSQVCCILLTRKSIVPYFACLPEETTVAILPVYFYEEHQDQKVLPKVRWTKPSHTWPSCASHERTTSLRGYCLSCPLQQPAVLARISLPALCSEHSKTANSCAYTGQSLVSLGSFVYLSKVQRCISSDGVEQLLRLSLLHILLGPKPRY